MKQIIYLFVLVVSLSACVSKKQYNDVLASEQKYYNEAQQAKKELADKKISIKELTSENDRLQTEIKKLAADTLQYSKRIFGLKEEISSLHNLNKELSERLGKSKSEEEVKLLLADLQKLQEKLQAREDDLRKTEGQLSQNQISLEAKQRALEEQQKTAEEVRKALEEEKNKVAEQQKAIDEKNLRLQELTQILDKKDMMMRELKNRVSKALTGFEGNGLTVTNKNGKIYVSLDEKLLFKSGKWDVDPKGVTALDNLAKLLAENPDVHVVIEGHTDNIPYAGSGQISDNWDLSVKRSTSIIRILLKNKAIDPIRITAAGRGEFLPVDSSNTSEARQKNRRTEIILSPNLDELMNLLSKE